MESYLFTRDTKQELKPGMMVGAWSEASVHSARRSGAMMYMRAGLPLQEVASLWKSNVVLRYAEEALEEVPANARLLGEESGPQCEDCVVTSPRTQDFVPPTHPGVQYGVCVSSKAFEATAARQWTDTAVISIQKECVSPAFYLGWSAGFETDNGAWFESALLRSALHVIELH